jgi:hypothetical protein
MNFLHADLFNSSGSTRLSSFVNSTNKEFTDELIGEGSFSLSIPEEEASTVQVGQIVKFSYGENSDDYVFAGVIEKISKADGDETNLVKINGRGVRSLLGNAVIYTSDRNYIDKTVGYIMGELFTEAQTRGALAGMSKTFTNTQDSNGVNFTANETLTIEEKLGNNLAEVARRHGEMAVDIWVKPDLSLNYYITRGTDKTVGDNPLNLRIGDTLLEYQRETQGPVKNAAVVVWGDNNIKTATRPSSISSYGRNETFLSLTNIQDSVTADLAISRMLDLSDDPTSGATTELTNDGPQPYIDFEIGDWVWLVDKLGTRTKLRIRAITLSEQDDGSVRIVPELGTVKAALEERLKRLIDRQEAKTADGNFDASAASTDLNGQGDLGAGSDIYNGTVVTYDNLLGEGTADFPLLDPDNALEFTNTTGFYLGVGDDVVALLQTDNDPNTPDTIIVFGVTERSGAITPVNQPIGVLSTGFPLRTDNLPNGFQGNINVEGGRGDLYDLAGNLGAGADAILGPNYGTITPDTFYGFSRNLASSFTLNAPDINTFSSAVFTRASYLLSNGRIILIDGDDHIEVRDPNTGIWTTAFNSADDIQDIAFDYSNEWLWIYSAGTSPVAGGPFYSMGPNDTAPVGRGDLGLGLSTTVANTSVRMAAGDGQLVLQYNNSGSGEPYRYYYKNSSNTGNFAWNYETNIFLLNSTGREGNDPKQVVRAEGFYYLTQYTPSTPDEVAINYFNNNTGITTTYLTGIEWGTDPRKPYGYTISNSGLHLITCVRDVSGTNRISLASNNLTSTSYIYTDNTTAVNSADFIGAPREIEPNKIRFSAHEFTGSGGAINGAYTYEVILT